MGTNIRDISENNILTKIIGGNIIIKESNNEIYFDFKIVENEIRINKRGSEEVEIINIGKELTNEELKEKIIEVLKVEKEKIAIHTIPKEYKFENQKTTDILIYKYNSKNEPIFIIGKRKFPPMGYAMFGGMVEKTEDFDENAKKELAEESSLKIDTIEELEEIGFFDLEEIRGTLKTKLFLKKIDRNEVIKAGDDITEVKEVTLQELFELFEKKQILEHHEELIINAMKITKDKNLREITEEYIINRELNALGLPELFASLYEKDKDINDNRQKMSRLVEKTQENIDTQRNNKDNSNLHDINYN